jgi:hypothetical protein
LRGIKSKKIIVILLVLLAAFLIVVSQLPSKPVNILPLMKDGMQDELTLLIYEEWIHDVMTISNSKWIDIWYYDYDLNGDGHMDKIVYIQSPFHCGSGGCSFDVWINDVRRDSDNEWTFIELSCDRGYRSVSGLVARLMDEHGQFHPEMRVSISRNKTNGFRDIEFFGPDNDFALKYDGRRYRWHSPD